MIIWKCGLSLSLDKEKRSKRNFLVNPELSCLNDRSPARHRKDLNFEKGKPKLKAAFCILLEVKKA